MQVSFPSLKNLTLSSLSIPNIQCYQLPSSSSFSETLTNLVRETCAYLKILFLSFMVNRLEQLEKFEIAYCELVEVINNEEGSSRENNINSIRFPSLKRVRIRHCPNLKGLFSCSKYENQKARNGPMLLSKMSNIDPFFDEKLIAFSLFFPFSFYNSFFLFVA